MSPQARALAVASAAFAVWFAVRTSPWLLAPDLVATSGLVVLACAVAREGSVLDLSLPRLGRAALLTTWHGLAAPAFVAAPF